MLQDISQIVLQWPYKQYLIIYEVRIQILIGELCKYLSAIFTDIYMKSNFNKKNSTVTLIDIIFCPYISK